jgi:hypothetical protein
MDLDAHVSQVSGSALSKHVGERRQDRRRGIEQDDARGGRVDVAEVPAERSV